jgi:PAS domain S-box-containing protein
MERALKEEHEQLDTQNEELKAINEELQATEEELQYSNEKLERMFESVTDGIVVADLDSTIIKVNEKAVQMHGFASDDELMGKKTFELIAPHDRKRKANNVWNKLKEGTLSGGEYTLLRADGSEFPGELSTSALKDASGKVIGHITTVRDITERRKAEEREDQLEQELNLASRLASIGQLAAGVAHEINNPLTGVIGFSHLMMNRDLPNDMKQDLQVINSEALRVAKIVENLLVFAHQRKTGREYMNINDIITRVLELRAYEMKVNNIDVETRLDPELPLTMADTGQLQQVFLNIVLNAEYFMTKAHNKGQLVVKTEKINGNIQVSFTDDGAGISPENLDKIFNPFFTTKEVGKGTGLGLSICHGIITQHKGRIYAQSESGKGATFVIELPIVAEPVQAGKAEVTKKEPHKPRGAKILVVDDEAAILTFLSRLLTEWGHSVETINTADAALERLKTERYGLILLDIKLPGMSGIELYHHIEKIAPALTRRVMFITGDIMESATRGFLEKSKAAHITKPLDIEVLKKTINHILN